MYNSIRHKTKKNKQMNIVMIGSGNVSAVLGNQFVKAGHEILQILSRNAAAASELAYQWNTESANYISLINKNADVYIVAVSDSAIADVAKNLKLPGKVVAHTAASVPMEVLKNVTDNYGVLYPLQSLSKSASLVPEIPFFIDAANEHTKKILNALAQSITKLPVANADIDKREKLHVAAVIVNNFTNHILALAEDFCKKEGIDFNALLPLLKNTIDRLQEGSPSAMQTGPAARQDEAIIARHTELLKVHPKLLEVYDFLTRSIQAV